MTEIKPKVSPPQKSVIIVVPCCTEKLQAFTNEAFSNAQSGG